MFEIKRILDRLINHFQKLRNKEIVFEDKIDEYEEIVEKKFVNLCQLRGLIMKKQRNDSFLVKVNKLENECKEKEK